MYETVQSIEIMKTIFNDILDKTIHTDPNIVTKTLGK